MTTENDRINNIGLNIVVIGTGMYVSGRGTDGFGTILPAIYEWSKKGSVASVSVAGAHIDSVKALKSKVEELDKLFNFSLNIKFFPEASDDPDAFKEAIALVGGPACAIVAVPDEHHHRIAGYCVDQGLHTLVVKPLAPSIAEVNDLIERRRRNMVYGAVEFHKRLDRSNMKLKDSVDGGLIGDPLSFLVEYSQRKSIPEKQFKKWVRSTNIFQYLGIHYVDIIYYVTRALPLRVMAVGQKNYLSSKGTDAYDSIQVVVEWVSPSGKPFTALFLTGWVDPENTSAMSDQRIKLIGTKGRFEADQKRRGISLVTDDRGIEEPNPDFCSSYGNGENGISFQGYGIDSVAQFLEDVAGVESGAVDIDDLIKSRPSFEESVVPTVIIEAANRSLSQGGCWVKTLFKDNEFIDFES